MRNLVEESGGWSTYQLGVVVGTLLELLARITPSAQNFLAGLEDVICTVTIPKEGA